VAHASDSESSAIREIELVYRSLKWNEVVGDSYDLIFLFGFFLKRYIIQQWLKGIKNMDINDIYLAW